ncbi:hypothetical protein HJG60_012076 [Phyllostomus discolor]|uniref:Uncharacterized protein n=1 Tax=Phyllostomus discolor TaxID=89673 RepID=A0A834DWQ5_9CHIR|nr:hypothetical protein HJG60_012076 [Phyllostomus discolor]
MGSWTKGRASLNLFAPRYCLLEFSARFLQRVRCFLLPAAEGGQLWTPRTPSPLIDDALPGLAHPPLADRRPGSLGPCVGGSRPRGKSRTLWVCRPALPPWIYSQSTQPSACRSCRFRPARGSRPRTGSQQKYVVTMVWFLIHFSCSRVFESSSLV